MNSDQNAPAEAAENILLITRLNDQRATPSIPYQLTEIQKHWYSDLKNLCQLNRNEVNPTFQYREDVEDAYYINFRDRAHRAVLQLCEMRRTKEATTSFKEIKVSEQAINDIYHQLKELYNNMNGPCDLDISTQILALIHMIRWKASIVESRGAKFVCGVSLRHLIPCFREFESLNNDNISITLYKTWSVFTHIENCYGKHTVDNGARHDDMEKVCSEIVLKIKENKIFGSEMKTIMEEKVFYFRGSKWDDRIEKVRNQSEVLYYFMKIKGDLFTSIEGGHFSITKAYNEERNSWTQSMRDKSKKILSKVREYEIDRDGRYYTFYYGWRTFIVYFGTVGSLIISAVAAALDLGEEGPNVFKRINFFATLAVSIDLLVLGVFKVVDRNDNAISDALYFKRRVREINSELNKKQYKDLRKALAFDSESVIDYISPINTSYASNQMNGDIISPKRMTFDEIKEMFYVMEHGYENWIHLVSRHYGQQYVISSYSSRTSIKPATGHGVHFTTMIRELNEFDNIDNLG